MFYAVGRITDIRRPAIGDYQVMVHLSTPDGQSVLLGCAGRELPDDLVAGEVVLTKIAHLRLHVFPLESGDDKQAELVLVPWEIHRLAADTARELGF